MAFINIKHRLMAALNSVFTQSRHRYSKDIERIKEMEQRAEQLKEQAKEEIKSQSERDLLQSDIKSQEQEIEKLKNLTKRLRGYAWNEEETKIHAILNHTLTSLLTETREEEEAQATPKNGVGNPFCGPTESEYLFQPKQYKKELAVFNIPKKKLKTIELDFTMPGGPGFCHVKNEFYLAGG